MQDGEIRKIIELWDADDNAPRSLQIVLTSEGIIIDAFDPRESIDPVSTFAQTYDELWDTLTGIQE